MFAWTTPASTSAAFSKNPTSNEPSNVVGLPSVMNTMTSIGGVRPPDDGGKSVPPTTLNPSSQFVPPALPRPPNGMASIAALTVFAPASVAISVMGPLTWPIPLPPASEMPANPVRPTREGVPCNASTNSLAAFLNCVSKGLTEPERSNTSAMLSPHVFARVGFPTDGTSARRPAPGSLMTEPTGTSTGIPSSSLVSISGSSPTVEAVASSRDTVPSSPTVEASVAVSSAWTSSTTVEVSVVSASAWTSSTTVEVSVVVSRASGPSS